MAAGWRAVQWQQMGSKALGRAAQEWQLQAANGADAAAPARRPRASASGRGATQAAAVAATHTRPRRACLSTLPSLCV